MKKILVFVGAVFLFFGCKKNEHLQFEKIIFHTSFCMGECPTYHLEIDKSKKVKLYSEQVYIEHDKFMYETDHSKVGYFTGAISDSIYSMLVKELKKCGIDTLTFKDVTCYDGSIKTIIVYYNGRRKYLKSMDTPEIARPLISLLRNICQSKYLHRTQEKFKIEE